MNRYAGSSSFGGLPPVVLNLIIINLLFFIAELVLGNAGIDLTTILGLFYIGSVHFKPWQLVTYMFMHGGWMHIIFNMFALYIFGPPLERLWGGKKFLTFYFLTGIGASLFYMGIEYFQIQHLASQLDPSLLTQIKHDSPSIMVNGTQAYRELASRVYAVYNGPMIGASGAIFGVLLGFGMLYPNVPLIFIFFPIPIKAKYFVMIYGGIELFQGIANKPGDHVAHFAHIGGLLVGYLIIRYWKSRDGRAY